MTPNRGTVKPVRASDTIMVPAVILPADPGYVSDPLPIDLTPPVSGDPIPYTGDSIKDIKGSQPPDYLLANPNVPIKRTTTYTGNDSGVIRGDGSPIIPVVVTTTTVNPPLPTLPAPLVPVTPTNNPYYVPGAVAPIATPAIQPPSPDPTSQIVNGTPIQTPNLPAPTTSVALNLPQATDTVNILGLQISKTMAVVGLLAGIWFLSSRK